MIFDKCGLSGMLGCIPLRYGGSKVPPTLMGSTKPLLLIISDPESHTIMWQHHHVAIVYGTPLVKFPSTLIQSIYKNSINNNKNKNITTSSQNILCSKIDITNEFWTPAFVARFLNLEL